MFVQFGNNWIQKIPLTAKLDSACLPRPILAVLGIFFIQLFPNWTACSPITYTNWKVGKGMLSQSQAQIPVWSISL